MPATSISARTLTACAATAAVALLAACASTDYHYSQLRGAKYHQALMDTYAVTIISVDGKSSSQRPFQVDPGMRHIVVQAPPTSAGQGDGTLGSIDLAVAPCTSYYLVAKKKNPLLHDFDVIVDHEEPIGRCTPPKA